MSRKGSRTGSRPTTPLRPPSRTSLHLPAHGQSQSLSLLHGAPANRHRAQPLDRLEGQFSEMADGIADLEANLAHLQLQHDSLARFSDSFAAFLYGMEVNAFCVDFPEAPLSQSFGRPRPRPGARAPAPQHQPQLHGVGALLSGHVNRHDDLDETFLYATFPLSGRAVSSTGAKLETKM